MTDQSPLERAARTLMLQRGLDPDVYIGMHGTYGYWLDDARAVLMAIRTPSEDMCQAARDAKYLFAIETQESDAVGWTFEAMIDSALEDSK